MGDHYVKAGGKDQCHFDVWYEIPDPKIAREKKRIMLEGDVPSPLHMPTGCPFRTRCRYATEQCAAAMPELTDRGNGHKVACWNK